MKFAIFCPCKILEIGFLAKISSRQKNCLENFHAKINPYKVFCHFKMSSQSLLCYFFLSYFRVFRRALYNCVIPGEQFLCLVFLGLKQVCRSYNQGKFGCGRESVQQKLHYTTLLFTQLCRCPSRSKPVILFYKICDLILNYPNLNSLN